MERRNFLKGTFGGITAGGILIAAANTDIEAFASTINPKADIDVATPDPSGVYMPSVGEILFNAAGQPVGVIASANYYHDKIDITGVGDTYSRFIAGPAHFDLTVHSYGPINIGMPVHERTK